LIAVHRRMERRDERAYVTEAAPVAGPAVACWRKPVIELHAVVPVGDRYDVGETGLVNVASPIPMRRAAIGFETGSDPCRGLVCGGGSGAVELDPEIGHHHLHDA